MDTSRDYYEDKIADFNRYSRDRNLYLLPNYIRIPADGMPEGERMVLMINEAQPC